MHNSHARLLFIGVDTGGTFTDAFTSDGRVEKVRSTPHDPIEAIMTVIGKLGIDISCVVGHGTTVATNAVLERKGAEVTLLTTAGFEDVLEIRRQNRPKLYDLVARWPEPLAPRSRRCGVDERTEFDGTISQPLDDLEATRLAAHLSDLRAEAVAVCLLHAYANSSHEELLGQAIRLVLGTDVALSLSHQVAPRSGEFERTSTTVLNAYLTPVLRDYLHRLDEALFHSGVRSLHVMHSNGGLVRAATAADRPVGTVLSGPAAGVLGAHVVARAAMLSHIITFDMGGTSTDVSLVPGHILEQDDGELAGFPLLVPMLSIETVGAGGGSIARVDAGGGLHVGPESAGADPGPAAYGTGELPTVTDANLVLGRLSTGGLLGSTIPLDLERARSAIATIADRLAMRLEEAAWSVIRLANSNMERAVGAVSLQRGHDPRRFSLVAFGGAGPLHAAETARGLGMTGVFVPPYPGVMAALGLTVPDVRRHFFRTVLTPLMSDRSAPLEASFVALEQLARTEIDRERFEAFGTPMLERFVDARYQGQSFELRIPWNESVEVMRAEFHRAHQERYGYHVTEEPVEAANIRIHASLPRLEKPNVIPAWPEPPVAEFTRKVWFGGLTGVGDLKQFETAVMWRPSLAPRRQVSGPAILEQFDCTTLVPPGWLAVVGDDFGLLLSRSA